MNILDRPKHTIEHQAHTPDETIRLLLSHISGQGGGRVVDTGQPVGAIVW